MPTRFSIRRQTGGFPRDSKAWAKTIPMPEDRETSRQCIYLIVDQVNPGLVDLFARQARKTVQEKEKGSVLQKLKQEPPARKPASPKKQEPGDGRPEAQTGRAGPVLGFRCGDGCNPAENGTVWDKNLSAYLRKMAVDGYVVQLDLPELKELVSLMRYSSNNLNQLTRKVHETGRVYDADLEDISQRQEQIWEGVKEILTQLSKLS